MPSLEITTMIGCPLMCTVCPQDVLKSSYQDKNKYLSIENYKIILEKIPHNVRIDFSGMSEPWINQNCTIMVDYTLTRGYDIAIYTTLIGMNRYHCDQLISLIHKFTSQIKTICIHLPDNTNNMPGWKNNENYKYALSNFLHLSEEIKLKINFHAMTMNSAEEIHKDISTYNIKLINWNKNWSAHTRADSLKIDQTNYSVVGQKYTHETPVSCASTPFYDRNVVLPNGDVLLCCMDYEMKHIIGNLLRDTYESLYLSPEMIRVMKENKIAKFSKCSICKSCHNAKPYKLINNHWSSQ